MENRSVLKSASYKILVIDDEESFRSLLVSFLTDEGHLVYSQENGAKALKFCETVKPDLIICDLFMPEKEGIETIAALKSQFGNSTKIIAVSGGIKNSSTNLLQIAHHLGADEILAKPFRLLQLKNTIESLFANEISC